MKFAIPALCLFLLSVRFSLAQTKPTIEMDSSKTQATGAMTSKWMNGGCYLDVAGIPLLRGGNVQLFSIDYKKGFYGSGGAPPTAKLARLPDGTLVYTATYVAKIENAEFAAVQTIETHPDNTVLFKLSANWKGAFPIRLEWNAAKIWAYPFSGAEFTGLEESVPLSGKIPRNPVLSPENQNVIGGAFSSFNLKAPLFGGLEIRSIDSPENPSLELPLKPHYVLLDSRNDPYLRQDNLFWLGLNGYELKPNSNQEFQLALKFTPRNHAPRMEVSAQEIQKIADRVKTADFRRPATSGEIQKDIVGNPVIIPEPKHAVFDGNDFPLRGEIPLTLAFPETEDGKRASRASREFTEEIAASTGVRWRENQGNWNQKGLLVTVQGSVPFSHPLSPALTSQPEGYALVVTPKFIVVIGNDPAGAYYGLQTLRQLLSSKGGKHRFVGADICDWPSLRFRGAHIFVGKDALPFHKKLIERIFSRYKLNSLVIECEYTKWKSHPEIHQTFSMEPSDLREEVEFARDHFMEPIPLVNSLGHSEWIFKNDQHLDIAEDVHAPHAYDASNPDSYRFIYDIFSETIDIFHPRHFHIGHDEVKVPSYDLFGKYPARPGNILKGATTLFMEDTNRLADWLRAKNIRTIMWADMLLHESEGDTSAWDTLSAANAPTLEEAKRRRALLPKDIIIADWRYHPGSEQRNGLGVLKAAGLDTLGCPWFEPENVRGWAKQAILNNSLGVLETTWAGYDSNENRLEDEFRQFTPFVLAGEYSWSGTEKRPRLTSDAEEKSSDSSQNDRLPYFHPDIFRKSYRPAPLSKTVSGWRLKLGDLVNVSRNPDPASDDTYLFAAKSRRESPLSHFTTSANETDLRLSGEKLTGMMFASFLAPEALFEAKSKNYRPITLPREARLPVNRVASKLRFLHTTLAGAETNTTVATYTIRYQDGEIRKIPIRYGREIAAIENLSPSNAFSTRALPLSSEYGNGSLHLFEWTNARPESVIESIELTEINPVSGLILYAIEGDN